MSTTVISICLYLRRAGETDLVKTQGPVLVCLPDL